MESYVISGHIAEFRKLEKDGRFWQIFVELVDARGEPQDINNSTLLERNYDNNYIGRYYTISGKIGTESPLESEYTTIGKTDLKPSKQNNVLLEALGQAQSKYNAKINRNGYHLADEEFVEQFEPMLVSEYQPKKLKAGSFIQPKYDGVRGYTVCDSEGQIHMFSRRDTEYFNAEVIVAELAELYTKLAKVSDPTKFHFDGELYVAGVPCEDVAGAMRADKDSLTADQKSIVTKAVYYMFDCRVDDEPDLVFSARYGLLTRLTKSTKLGHVKVVEMSPVNTDEEVQRTYKTYIDRGLEGAVIHADVPYASGKRSTAAMKLKPTFDAVYTIVGFDTGVGKAAGKLKLKLLTDDGKEFQQMWQGTDEASRALYKEFQDNFDKFRGKSVKLHYGKDSKSGKPSFVKKTEIMVE
jgi:ATP-dependent DNA ligase